MARTKTQLISRYFIPFGILALVAVGGAVTAHRAHPWPTLHPDFATHAIQTEHHNIGYFYTDAETGNTCCHTELERSSEVCKLQMTYEAGDYAEQGTRNRTRQGGK